MKFWGVLVRLQCPPGFVFEINDKSCLCSSFLTELGITQCDIDTMSVYIPPQLGFVDNGNIFGYLSPHLNVSHVHIIESSLMCQEVYRTCSTDYKD